MNQKTTSIKKVFINSSLYTITSILQKAIGFILLPIYTMYLTPEDYGITGLVTSLTSVLSLFFTLSLNGAVTRFYYDFKDDEEKLREFWGTIVVFVLINSITLSALIILFKNSLITPFVGGVNFYPYILIGILTIVVTPIYTIYQSILQTKQEASNYAINSTLNFIFMVIFNILFIVVFKLGAVGQLLSYLITGLIFALYSVYMLVKRKLIKLTINKEHLHDALKYSIPLLPHLMSMTIANFVSRIFLNNQASTADLGLFNVGSQFLIIIDTLQMSVNNAYVPWFFELMAKGKSENNKVINFADFLLRANCVLSLAMSLYIKEVIQIMTNPAYLAAWVVVPIMVVAYQIRGIYLFYVNTLFYNKSATKFIFIATLSGNIISIVLSALLTERFGIMTPAIVLVIEKTITTIIVVFLSKKIEPIDFKLGKMLVYIFILIIGSATGLVFDLQNPTGNIEVFNILYKLIVLLLISFVILKSNIKLIVKNIKQVAHKK